MIELIQDFSTTNSIRIYNEFQDVIDVVCRRDFIVKFIGMHSKSDDLNRQLKIKIPKTVFFMFSELSSPGFVESKEAAERIDGLKFPVIVKPRISSILSTSHNLLIVANQATLLNILDGQSPEFEKYNYLK